MSRSVVADLYALQDLDLEVDRVAGDMEALRRGMGADTTRPEREAALRARKRAEQMRGAAQTAESALHDLEARIRKQEQRLYGGSTGARDLGAMQTELTHMKAAHAEQEEGVLAHMLAAEEAETAARAAVATLRSAERAWETKRQEMGARLTADEAQLDELRERRAVHAEGIGVEVLRRYDTLRRAHGGRALALVQSNTCQVCRVAVASAAVQRARAGTELVPCPNCGRILFAR